MVVWFGIAFTSGALSMAAFGTIHLAVGVGLTYFLICGFMNSTHIGISFREISVSHEPLPWPGRKTIPIGDRPVSDSVSL